MIGKFLTNKKPLNPQVDETPFSGSALLNASNTNDSPAIRLVCHKQMRKVRIEDEPENFQDEEIGVDKSDFNTAAASIMAV